MFMKAPYGAAALARLSAAPSKTKKKTLTAIVSYSYSYAEAKDLVTMDLPVDGSEPVAFGETGPVVVLDGLH
jgi:hypothetical protein